MRGGRNITEHEIQNQIIDYLKTTNWLVIRINGVNRGKIKSYYVYNGSENAQKGLPDLLIMKKGKCIGLEIKTATGKQSEDQKIIEKWFKMQEIEYYVIKSLNDVINVLKED